MPWIRKTILDFKPSLDDLALLISSLNMACIAICTEVVLSILPNSVKGEEEQIAKRFTRIALQELPAEIKRVDIVQGNDIYRNTKVAFTSKHTTKNLPD